MKTRFARFANVPELLRMLHVAADVKTAEDLDLPVPDLKPRADGQRAPETVIVEPSDELLDYVATSATGPQGPNRAVDPDEDNMLKISSDGRRAALDLRLLGLPQTDPGQDRRRRRPDRRDLGGAPGRRVPRPRRRPDPVRGSLQLVFCDLGTPRAGLERLRRAPRPARRPRRARARRSGSSTRPTPTRTRPSCSPPAAPAGSPC